MSKVVCTMGEEVGNWETTVKLICSQSVYSVQFSYTDGGKKNVA